MAFQKFINLNKERKREREGGRVRKRKKISTLYIREKNDNKQLLISEKKHG